MEAFLGDWTMVSKENMDEYLTTVGHDDEVIQIGKIVNPAISISQEGEMVVIKLKSSIRTDECSFILGEEFDEDVLNIQSKSVVYLDGDKLVHVKKWDDQTCTHIREIKNGQLIVTMKCGDSEAVATFKRVSEVA